MQFGANVGAVGFDGFNAATEKLRNILAAVARAYQMQHFKFAGSQAV
jgi:hypothetical protein